MILGLAGVDPLEGRPNIEKWIDAVKETMQPYYDEAHLDFYKITKDVAAMKL